MWLNLGRVIAGGRCDWGVVGCGRVGSAGPAKLVCGVSGKPLERVAVVGESPVRESAMPGLGCFPE
jgi:hypothetical protein